VLEPYAVEVDVPVTLCIACSMRYSVLTICVTVM
jgi:hypothetical protein